MNPTPALDVTRDISGGALGRVYIDQALAGAFAQYSDQQTRIIAHRARRILYVATAVLIAGLAMLTRRGAWFKILAAIFVSISVVMIVTTVYAINAKEEDLR